MNRKEFILRFDLLHNELNILQIAPLFLCYKALPFIVLATYEIGCSVFYLIDINNRRVKRVALGRPILASVNSCFNPDTNTIILQGLYHRFAYRDPHPLFILISDDFVSQFTVSDEDTFYPDALNSFGAYFSCKTEDLVYLFKNNKFCVFDISSFSRNLISCLSRIAFVNRHLPSAFMVKTPPLIENGGFLTVDVKNGAIRYSKMQSNDRGSVLFADLSGYEIEPDNEIPVSRVIQSEYLMGLNVEEVEFNRFFVRAESVIWH